MKLDGAVAVPPALPQANAPYGTLLCSRPKCRTIMPKTARLGAYPPCSACGGQVTMHPESRKPKGKVAAPARQAVGVGDLSVFDRRMFREGSLIDYWSADNECAHDQLPHEACGPCGREASVAPPSGMAAVVSSERLLHHIP